MNSRFLTIGAIVMVVELTIIALSISTMWANFGNDMVWFKYFVTAMVATAAIPVTFVIIIRSGRNH